MEKIEIKFDSKKMMMSVVALVILAIGSAAMIFVCYQQQWTILFGNWGWMGVWGFATLAFALAGVFMVRRSANPLPAFILDEEGIIDNAGLVRGTKHKWSDIQKIEQKKVMGSTLILVYLKNPLAFIEAQSGIKRRMLNSSYNQQGTPVSIPGKALEGNSDDLLKLLCEQLEKRKAAVV